MDLKFPPFFTHFETFYQFCDPFRAKNTQKGIPLTSLEFENIPYCSVKVEAEKTLVYSEVTSFEI